MDRQNISAKIAEKERYVRNSKSKRERRSTYYLVEIIIQKENKHKILLLL